MSSLPFFTLDDFDLVGKTVLLRVDINSPLNPRTGAILDDARFKAHLETLKDLNNSKVVILAHQSRPGKSDFVSLRVHAAHLSYLLRRRVKFVPGLFEEPIIDEIKGASPGDILMLENTRFYSEEVVLSKEKMEVLRQTNLIRNLTKVADYFVNDAFAAAHRPNATLTGFTDSIPNIAGRLMAKEISSMEKFFNLKSKNRTGIFGGAKADDSIKIIKRMLNENKLDIILTGGLIAHVFLIADGVDMGEKNTNVIKKEISNFDEVLKQAKEILTNHRRSIRMPSDFLGVDGDKPCFYKLSNFRKDVNAMDIGVDTIATYASVIKNSDAILLNGPMGVFELKDFEAGTVEVFSMVAKSKAFKIAGGGHTLAALEKMHINGSDIDHISTGGGALINYLAGEPMPVIESLIQSKNKFGGE